MSNIIKHLKINYAYICLVILCFLMVFVLSYYNLDPDFGWHLEAGKNIFSGGIPNKDIFTFTASDFKWINHEWLNDVLVYSLFSMGGYLLTAIFYSSLWIAGLLIAQRHKLKLAFLLATISLLPFSGIRPVVWTVLMIALLERILFSKKNLYKYAIPLIFLLWSNLHGSFAFGLIVLTLYQLFSKAKVSWPIYILSLISVFVNPYGIMVFEEIIRTAADSQLRFRISEWKPVLLPYISLMYLITAVPLHFSIAKNPFKKALSIPGLTLIMTASSIRHLPIFIATSLRYTEIYMISLRKKLKSAKRSRKINILIFVSSSLFWLSIFAFSALFIRNALYGNEGYPEKATEYLISNPCKTNIFNSYNYGGYLIWKLPDTKVYIDGRMPSWKLNNENYFENYVNFINDDTSRKDQILKYNIGCILLTESDANQINKDKTKLIDRLKKENWRLIEEASNKSTFLLIK